MHTLTKLLVLIVNLNSEVNVYDQQLMVSTVHFNSEIQVHDATSDVSIASVVSTVTYMLYKLNCSTININGAVHVLSNKLIVSIDTINNRVYCTQ